MPALLFCLYLPVWLVAWPLCYVLAPLAAWTADKNGRLIWPLRWLETHDAPGWEGPQTEHATAKYSPRLGLMIWLWRNKGYRLRHWMRARPSDASLIVERGVTQPPKFGFSYWYGSVDGYFEFQPRLSWGGGYFFSRIGWKMKPWVAFGVTPDMNSSIGIFSFSPLRHDDWDDFT